jgi:NTE family protein
MKEKYKIGIALSGGGTRGIFHLGVLKALEDNGFYPEAIAGTSAGCIVGSLYAAGIAVDDIYELASKGSLFNAFGISFPSRGFAKHNFLDQIIKKNLPVNSFDVMEKKLFIAIANINSGLIEYRDAGELHKVILASCSIPFVYKPIEMDGAVYLDGGLLKNLPASPLRPICDIVLGVNLVAQTQVSEKQISNIMSLANRVFDISVLNNIRPEIQHCDIVIESEKLNAYGRFSFSKTKEMYDLGYEVTLAQLPELKLKIDDLNT